jgi:hypothetical protein
MSHEPQGVKISRISLSTAAVLFSLSRGPQKPYYMAEDSDTAVLYFCLFCSAGIQYAELAGIRSAGTNPVSSIKSGRILRSCWHRFQSVHVFWQGRMFSRQHKFRSASRSWIPACCWLLG